MPRRSYGLAAFGCTLALLLGACAAKKPAASLPVSTHSPAAVHAAAAPAPRAVVPTIPADPVADLITLSNTHFSAGERELGLGHLDTARAEFNRSIDVLLESPYGARVEPRIREHFDRLVDRISAYEVTALAQGDGFTEKKYTPASIDELLSAATFEPPDPSAATKTAVEADRARHDIEIPLNERVLSFVELFSGRLKNFLQDGLTRGARFLPMIQDVFRAEGLPLDLAYVPLVESAFRPDAVSRAKAKGMWQFMSGTALENGLKHDWYIDERAEPEKATRAAAKYLKTLYSTFGDWQLVLASYNGGPGRVQKAMKASGTEDFWKLSAGTRYLPRETRDYVPLILAAVIIAKNPAQYGFDLPVVEPPTFERVMLPVATDIRRIAEWIGTSVEKLQELNPELRRWTTPVRASNYALKVPEGTAAIVAERLAQADPDELASLKRYTVKRGETLASIARALKVSRADLAEANYLPATARVAQGQQLIIPRPPSQLLAARAETTPAVAESRRPDRVVPASNVQASRSSRAEQSKTIYRVKRGDTLFSIAQAFDTSVASLRAWNRLRSNAIQTGQRLTIFTPRNATN